MKEKRFAKVGRQGGRKPARQGPIDGARADRDPRRFRSFFELGLYAAHGMYEEWGGAPAAGVITGMARIQTRMVMIIANDATVKAGRVLPDDLEESHSSPEHCHREPHSHDLPGRFCGRVSAAAGRCLPRYRRLRPRLPQQRRDVGHGYSADRGDHGHVRGRWRISAGDVRSRVDDRWQRIVSRRPGAGAGRNWPESFRRRIRRGGHALRHQRHRRLSRAQRRSLYRAHSIDRREVGIPAAVSLGSQETCRARARCRKKSTESTIRRPRVHTT